MPFKQKNKNKTNLPIVQNISLFLRLHHYHLHQDAGYLWFVFFLIVELSSFAQFPVYRYSSSIMPVLYCSLASLQYLFFWLGLQFHTFQRRSDIYISILFSLFLFLFLVCGAWPWRSITYQVFTLLVSYVKLLLFYYYYYYYYYCSCCFLYFCFLLLFQMWYLKIWLTFPSAHTFKNKSY